MQPLDELSRQSQTFPNVTATLEHNACLCLPPSVLLLIEKKRSVSHLVRVIPLKCLQLWQIGFKRLFFFKARDICGGQWPHMRAAVLHPSPPALSPAATGGSL